jgi:hypothetical protein
MGAPPVPENELLEMLARDFYAYKTNSEKKNEQLVDEIVKIRMVNAELQATVDKVSALLSLWAKG